MTLSGWMNSARSGKVQSLGASVLMELGGATLLESWMYSPTWKFQTPHCWDSYGCFITYIWLVTDSISRPSLENRRWGWKLLIKAWSSWWSGSTQNWTRVVLLEQRIFLSLRNLQDLCVRNQDQRLNIRTKVLLSSLFTWVLRSLSGNGDK